MPEGGTTLESLRRFIYPSFAALSEQDTHVLARHGAAEMLRFGTTLFEEPGCNHLPAVLEVLDEARVRRRAGPGTGGAAGAPTCPTGWRWTRMPRWRGCRTAGAQVRQPRLRNAVTIEGVGTTTPFPVSGSAHCSTIGAPSLSDALGQDEYPAGSSARL